jgi:hypothetical protein
MCLGFPSSPGAFCRALWSEILTCMACAGSADGGTLTPPGAWVIIQALGR